MGDADVPKVLVTGGASGIGAAVVAAFARAGARVVVLDRAAAVPDGSPAAGYVSADVADDPAVRAAVHAAAAILTGLDVVVNNAGTGGVGTVLDASDDEWHRVLDINVVGIARVSRAAWPYLAASPHPAIVNVASVAATVGLPQRAVYSASKGAVLALTRAMAADGLRHGIRVNAVSPGTVDTPWLERLVDAGADADAQRAALVARQPHGRLVLAEEVAHAVLYLASSRAGSTTGTELAVDGGMAGLRGSTR